MPKRRLTKNGNKRIGHKANITANRLRLRAHTWNRVRYALMQHVFTSPKGEAERVARALGISASQVHRFVCPACEHDQEPCFTIGFSILMYLSQQKLQPIYELAQPRKVATLQPTDKQRRKMYE